MTKNDLLADLRERIADAWRAVELFTRNRDPHGVTDMGAEIQALERTRVEIEKLDIRARRDAPAGTAAAVADTPTEPSEGTVTDRGYDRELHLQRSWLNHFCKLDGKEWRGEGPDPLSEGHKIRPQVIAEYREKLDRVALLRAQPEAEPRR